MKYYISWSKWKNEKYDKCDEIKLIGSDNDKYALNMYLKYFSLESIMSSWYEIK